ncbi:MAG: VOC family protein [Actinomycetota bacterium]|nr:VOC family protein [Actinomycetota bacterium]
MSELPEVEALHHLTLSVTDVEASAQWYQALMGESIVVTRETPTWSRTRLQWPNGIIIVFTKHQGTDASDCFDHNRVGLDHIGLSCPSEAAVRAWAARLDALNFAHGPVEDVDYGWAVTARDPDGIAVEFFCRKL